MVGNKNHALKNINPLTGEETTSIEYYFITGNNVKIKLGKNGTDSITSFPDQEELQLNYINNSEVFQVLYNSQAYLFNKKGRQLSSGFDNIYECDDGFFFITELSVKQMNEIRRAKGLININGKTIVKCENKYIHINKEDSVIYCCSAVFSSAPADEVFDYKGNLIFSCKNHIVYSSGHIHVSKLYAPKEVYFIENTLKKSEMIIEGDGFYYLSGYKAIITKKGEWVLVDLQNLKKQKVNKEEYNRNLNFIFE